MAVFAVGQHHAGDEGPQRRGQADGPHQEGNANDDQQRNGGEQLADMGPGDDPEQGADGVAPPKDNGENDRDRHPGLPPGRQVLGQVKDRFFAAVPRSVTTCAVAARIVTGAIVSHSLAGAVAIPAREAEATRVREEGQHGEDRDDGYVLEQQHGKGVLSRGRRHLALLIEGLQHDRRRGQGQRQPEGQCHTPVQPEHLPQPPHGRRCNQHLRAADADNGRPQPPQLFRLEFEADKEQHHHHAEFGDVGDLYGVGAQPAQHRRNRHPGDEISQHGPQSQSLEQRNDNDGGAQKQRREEQERRSHCAAPSPAAWRASRLRRVCM